MACAVLFVSHGMTIVFAAEEEPQVFRITGVEGAFALGHTRNEVEQGVEGQGTTRSRSKENEQGFSFLSHSYVYHPNLLNIDFGAGILFNQKEYEAGAGKQETEGELYSLTAQLRFLEKKPYPLTLYYDRTHPTAKVSETERFISNSEKYGLKAGLLRPILPFSIEVEAFRQQTEGTGPTQIIDTQNDQVFIRAYRYLEHNGHIQLTYHNNQHISESGVNGQPIQKTDRTSESTSLSSDVKFGERNQFQFINLLSYYTQDNLPRRQEFAWSPSLIWKHTGKSESFYRYSYNESEVDAISSISRSGAIGGSASLTDRLKINGEVRGRNYETAGLESQSRGASSGLSYTYPLGFGHINFSAGTSYDVTQNVAPTRYVTQQSERLKYDGIERLQLIHAFVDEIINIAVERNGVIVYPSVTKDVDYKRVDDGPLTYIQVIIKTDPAQQKIQLGDSLIVDYTYDTGGTFEFSTFNHHYSTYMTLFEYYSVYASYSNTEYEIKEGYSSVPLNSMENRRIGAKVDHPLSWNRFRIGAEAIYEEQDEELSPYVRRTGSTFFQANLGMDTRFRVSYRRVRQDNLYTDQDADIRSRSVTLTTRPWPRSSLRYEHREDEDTGRTEVHSIIQDMIQIQWRVRQLTLSLEGTSIEEKQGTVIRDSYSISADLIRTF